MSRRLPVYVLLDTSGSMKGEPIESVKNGLASLVASLRTDPHALDTVHLCLMTFDRDVRTLVPLTPLDEFILPELVVPDSGPTMTGLALREVCRSVRADVIKSTESQKGDWRPLLFIMTDGVPSDSADYAAIIPHVKSLGFGTVVGCAAVMKSRSKDVEKSKQDADKLCGQLKQLCSHVVTLDTMDGNTFLAFFRWVSSAVANGNVSAGTSSEINLPPPPPEISVVC